jgi:hypothetical protein
MEGAHSVRSLAPIDAGDLLRLAGIAGEVEAVLFARHPQGAGRYAGRLLCRALCQGAALHYPDGKNGVKDFDVWSFYAVLGNGPFPPTGGAGRPTTVHRNSAAIPATRPRLPAAALTCSAGRWTHHPAQSQPPPCADGCRQHAPTQPGS